MENTEYIELIMAQVEQLDKIADNLSDKYKTAKNILKEYTTKVKEGPRGTFTESINPNKLCNRNEAIELLVEEDKTFEVIDAEYLMNIRFIKTLVLAHQDTILAYKISKRVKAQNGK